MNKFISKTITILGCFITCFCLLYYGSVYYMNAKLVFNKYQFKFYLVFVFLFFWIVGYLLYSNCQLRKNNKIIKDNNDKIKQDTETIKELVKFIAQEQIINHQNTVELTNNTRDILLQFISDERKKNDEDDRGLM